MSRSNHYIHSAIITRKISKTINITNHNKAVHMRNKTMNNEIITLNRNNILSVIGKWISMKKDVMLSR